MYSVLDLQKLVQMLSFLGISPGSGAPAHSVVFGGGTYAIPGTAGTLLTSNGVSADPSFQSLASLGVNGIGAPAHAVVLGGNTDVPIGAAGTILSSTGTGNDPSYQTLAALGIQPAGTYAPLPLPANSVGSSQIANGAVGSAQLATGAVVASKLATGAVGDVAVSTTSALYQRLTQWGSVMDPAYGAVGDGVTDDTTAIQSCVNANAYVFFPAGKKFKTTAVIAVPTTCLRIDGTAAFMTGPGITGTVDGFSFNNFYQGGGSIPVKSELYVLPSMNGYRYGISLINSAFLRIFADTIENVVAGFFISCNSSSNYCFELELEARNLWHCRNSANTLGAAFYWQSTGTANAPFQGNRSKAFYCDDCWAGVYHEYTSSGSNGIFNNEYDLGELDQSNYFVYATPAPNSSSQTYRLPIGITDPVLSFSFSNYSTSDQYEIGALSFNDPSWLAFNNSQLNGTTNRPGIPIFTAAGGQAPTAFVSPSGSDTTGNGSGASPFATIQKALNIFEGLDLFGQTAIISVQNGTYSSSGATAVGLASAGCSGQIAIVGNQGSPSSVVINGSFTANGPGASITVSGMEIANGGLLAQNGGVVNLGPDVIFAGFAGGSHILAETGGVINLNSSYSINGAASQHLYAYLGGMIIVNASLTCSLSGSLPFSTFAVSSNGGEILAAGATYSGGSVSGNRYLAQKGGGIDTNGGGANFFPGTSTGTISSPGWYA